MDMSKEQYSPIFRYSPISMRLKHTDSRDFQVLYPLSIKTLELPYQSNFNPSRTHHTVETFVSLVDREVKYLLSQKSTSLYADNLTHDKRQALNNFKQDHLMIKPADKGGSIVVMNKTDYMEETAK